MRVVLQRVKEAKVVVDGQVTGSIGHGLLVFFAVHQSDTMADIPWMVNKVLNLRLFRDENDKMNLSIKEVLGEVLVVSQFTLYGNCMNGRRPDFIDSAPPTMAIPIYEAFVSEIKKDLGKVQTGVFGAAMEVSLINDGPVTFVIDGKK